MTRSFDLVDVTIADVANLFRRFHAYGSVGKFQAYAFAVLERGEPVAAYVWQPPPPAAARAVCAALPVGVLALSRMVAVPKAERALKHISKPLKYQMRRRIDRSRWPILVTYSDESVGHTGYVYQCSGWTPTVRHRVKTLTVDGKRRSRYANGGVADHGGAAIEGLAWIQRWEHWVTQDPAAMFEAAWRRVPIEGKVWRSGNQAYRYERIAPVAEVAHG